MTNRERIVNTFCCRPADRAPFGLGFGFYPWVSACERWKIESGDPDLDVADRFGFDRDFVRLPLELGPLPRFEERVLAEDEAFITSMDYRGLTKRNRRDHGSMPEFLDYPVKSVDDWKRYKEERLQPRLEARTASLDACVASLRDVDAPVQAGWFPWGLFGSPRDLLGAEELLIGFCTELEMIHDMMATFTDLWLALYERAAARVRIDHIHIWEDMSGRNGSLISMAMVEEFMMPHYDRIAAFAREHEVPIVSVDSDGRVTELLRVFVRHGVTAFFPFEVQAGNDVLEVRREFPALGIMGGLDKNALADDAPPGAMHRELDRAEAMLALGGYVPSLDHLVPPNVSWRTWSTFLTELRKLIGLG